MMDWAEISEEKKYTDTQGNKLTLHQMVCTEPMWTKNRLLRLQKELEALQAENRNLKATAKIAVQAGESLQKELEAVKGENKTLLSRNTELIKANAEVAKMNLDLMD